MRNGSANADKQDDRKKQKDGAAQGKYGQAMLLGTSLAVGMAVFSLAGYYLDRKRGGGIFWTLCGMMIGLAYGAYEIWKIIRMLDSGEKPAERSSERGPDSR